MYTKNKIKKVLAFIMQTVVVLSIIFSCRIPAFSFQDSDDPYGFLEKESEFVVTPELEPMVSFWKDIYTKYPRHKVVIHDRNNLDIIYEVFDTSPLLEENYSNRQIWKIIGNKRLHYKRIIIRITFAPFKHILWFLL